MVAIAKFYNEEETKVLCEAYSRNTLTDREFLFNGGYTKVWFIGFIQELLEPYGAHIVIRPSQHPESHVTRLEAGPKVDSHYKPYTHFVSCAYQRLGANGEFTPCYLSLFLNFEEDSFNPNTPGEDTYWFDLSKQAKHPRFTPEDRTLTRDEAFQKYGEILGAPEVYLPTVVVDPDPKA